MGDQTVIKIAYICRGYPGLGKVMGCLALHEMLQENALFFTYLQGLEYLQSLGCRTVDLLAGGIELGRNRFCTPLGPECERLARGLSDFAPDLVVNDGEPYLIPVTREVLGLPTMVLAHPLDLHNPRNSGIGVAAFRYLYSLADWVVAHGVEEVPSTALELGGRAGRALLRHTLVRKAIYEAGQAGCNEIPVVAVMGGGSVNASDSFRQHTLQLARWTDQACSDLELEGSRLYCADSWIYEQLQPTCAALRVYREPQDIAQPLLRARVVVGRSGRNLISELVAMGKPAVVCPAGGGGYRGGSQWLSAEAGRRVNPNLRINDLQRGYPCFRNDLQQAYLEPPRSVVWRPANQEVADLVRSWV